jgi:hypothetical protein
MSAVNLENRMSTVGTAVDIPVGDLSVTREHNDADLS